MTRICSGILLYFIFTGWVFAQTIKPTIAKVIVYYDSAMIKKEATIPLRKGENSITLEGLPASMIDESVQVSVKGAFLQDVKVQTTYLKKGDTQRINSIKEKLETIKNELAAKQNEITALQTVLEYIKKGSISPFTVTMTAPQIQSLLQMIEQYSIASHVKIAKLQQEIQKLNQEKAQLEKELAMLTTDEATKVIHLLVSHSGSDTAQLALQYIVTNTGWSMEYEARTDSEQSKIDVICNAAVYQRTGEDWSNVSLELSTSKPFVARQRPVLNPWYLDIYTPPTYYKESAKSMALRSEEDLYQTPQEAEVPIVQEERIAFSFQVKGNRTIPSDGNSYKILIARATTECTLRYATVPKVLSYVLLEGEFVNPFDFPMQGGSMSVYVDGRYVNSFTLEKLFVPKDTITIALGVDESIAVERTLISKKTEYKGLINKTHRVEYVYTIKLSNGKKRDVTVTVADAIPVSQNEKIVVQLINKATIQAAIDNDGKAIWVVDLKPNQKKELTIHFSVEFPDNIKVSGLE